MPELPEVETVVRGLRGDVVGRAFTTATVHWAREIVSLSPTDFAARLVGQHIEALTRRGKYIVFALSHDFLMIHLKMTGRLYLARPSDRHEADPWLRVVFGLDNGQELRFSDARKFGRVYLVAQPEVVLGRLGLEPLSDSFTLEAFKALASGRSGALKPLLLDQTFLAGIGNIYADEALWQAGIDPRRKVNTLRDDELELLYHAIRAVLEAGIDHEGASVSWYRKPDGTPGSQQNYFKVYGREDQPCPRCGTAIHKIFLGQRGTHFCPMCQT